MQKEIAERQRREISDDDDDASEDAGDPAMEVMKLACERRAVIKCPSCEAQDHYEMKRLEFHLRRHEVDHPLDEKARRLATSTQYRFWLEDEIDEDWKRFGQLQTIQRARQTRKTRGRISEAEAIRRALRTVERSNV